ncbi:MAG: GntR family transcriptional regulator [Rhodobacterales bacterium]|jgi:GntR family histidine utilization transcriptional repressor|nr:GntR family transcriptional regulator [Rhodobacterales bacterium]
MTGWQDIEAEALRRIHARAWPPGSTIPHEADLAKEFGVARATVNRALQALADAGWLDRRRKAGTRVALHPVRKATFSIPILRAEIEGADSVYGYRLLGRTLEEAPAPIAARLGVAGALLHVTALHLADGRPYAHEDRWVNVAAVPGIMAVDLAVASANEWLVTHAPFVRGDYAIGAAAADDAMAGVMGAAIGAALVTVERTTWDDTAGITAVRITFREGHWVRTVI